jgi:hypothetical protein
MPMDIVSFRPDPTTILKPRTRYNAILAFSKHDPTKIALQSAEINGVQFIRIR